MPRIFSIPAFIFDPLYHVTNTSYTEMKIEFSKWATIIMFFKIHYLISGGLLGIILKLFMIVKPLTTYS